MILCTYNNVPEFGLLPIFNFDGGALGRFFPGAASKTIPDFQYVCNGAYPCEQDVSFLNFVRSVPQGAIVVLNAEYEQWEGITLADLWRWLDIARRERPDVLLTTYGLWNGDDAREWTCEWLANPAAHPNTIPKPGVKRFLDALDIINLELYSTGAMYEARDELFAVDYPQVAHKIFPGKTIALSINHDSVNRSPLYQTNIQKAAKGSGAQYVFFFEPVATDAAFIKGFA